jgi:hypothetical protein
LGDAFTQAVDITDHNLQRLDWNNLFNMTVPSVIVPFQNNPDAKTFQSLRRQYPTLSNEPINFETLKEYVWGNQNFTLGARVSSFITWMKSN